MLKKFILVLIVVMIMFTMLPNLASAHVKGVCKPRECYAPVFRGKLTIKGKLCPGSTITVSGTGFRPGTQVNIFFDGSNIGQATVNSRCTATFQYTIPSDTRRGFHTIKMQGERNVGGTLVLSKTIYIKICKPKKVSYPGSSSIFEKILGWL